MNQSGKVSFQKFDNVLFYDCRKYLMKEKTFIDIMKGKGHIISWLPAPSMKLITFKEY